MKPIKVGPQFPATELAARLSTAMTRWGDDTTMAHWGDVLRVYQNGVCCAIIDLDTPHPALVNFTPAGRT